MTTGSGPLMWRGVTGRERRSVVAGALVLGGLGAWYAARWIDWAGSPVLGVLALGLLLGGGPVGLLVSLRCPRADDTDTSGLCLLEPAAARRALRGELWAGRLGPPALRGYARGWAARRLARHGYPGSWFFLAGIYLTPSGPVDLGHGPGAWLTLATAAMVVLIGAVEIALNHRAIQIARALERQPPPPPRGLRRGRGTPWDPFGRG